MDSGNLQMAQRLLSYCRDVVTGGPSPKRLLLPKASRATLRSEARSLRDALSHAIRALGDPLADASVINDAFVIINGRHQLIARFTHAASVVHGLDARAEIMSPAMFVDLAVDECIELPHSPVTGKSITETASVLFPSAIYFEMRSLLVERLIRAAAYAANVEITAFGSGEIRRSISFSPALKQAAIGILSYFGQVLEHRYPDMNVAVTIEQARERVTLIVLTPQGTEERIERELEEYGRVVTGEISPEEYLSDEYAVIALKHKLEIAALEVRQTKDLLYSERRQYSSRITALEEDVKFLRTILDRGTYDIHSVVEAVESIVSLVKPQAKVAIERFVNSLQRDPSLEAEASVELAGAIREDPSVLTLLRDMLLRGAVQGAAGNYLYNLLQAISATLL
jgi:hypothetical protein